MQEKSIGSRNNGLGVWVKKSELFPLAISKMKQVETVLDIGCGIRPQTFIIPQIHICCEPFEQYLNILKDKVKDDTSRVYRFINADWEKALEILPDKSVDTVFLVDIIEHLPKEKSLKLLKETDRIARAQIAVFTTLGFIPQHHPDGKDAWGLDGGVWQEHRSGWEPEDFGAEWDIVVSPDYHQQDNMGNNYQVPHGAIWAIKNLKQPEPLSAPTPAPTQDQAQGALTAAEVVNRLSALLRQLRPEEMDKFHGALAPIIAEMAKTGKGTDACLDQGCLPLPVHFYSPVPDLKDLQQRGTYRKISDLAGINWDLDRQAEFLHHFGTRFGRECNWSPQPTSNPDEYFTENSNFSFGCAAALHCVIRFFQPRRIMEIGSGNSSKIINAAVLQNKQEFGGQCDYTICDPYPDRARIGKLAAVSNLLPQRVETLPVSAFGSLGDGDVLFVDSGHVVRAGGDVNYLILDVLPTLAPGVVVHFHDIPMPYEYPEAYHSNPSFRVFWTESYLLQAFLACNQDFEVLLSMAAITAQRPEVLRAAFPLYDPSRHQLISNSLWLRRKE